MINVSMLERRPRLSLTEDGKVAPPSPTTPASATLRAISSADSANGSATGSQSIHLSSPSVSMVIAIPDRPDGCGAAISPMALTTPEVEACNGAEMLPCAAAISSPLSTFWPISTTGRDGAPTCCESIRCTRGGIGSARTRASAAGRL